MAQDKGSRLGPELRRLPGANLSNAPEVTATASLSWTPPIGNSGLSGLFFINARTTDDYNTGSDLLYGTEQDAYTIVNGRIGITGPDRRWGLELWANNVFDVDYTQVAFNTPFVAPQQTYSAFLAEPRTYGITVRRLLKRVHHDRKGLGITRCRAPFSYTPPKKSGAAGKLRISWFPLRHRYH